jgi:acyl-CoA hydrolase
MTIELKVFRKEIPKRLEDPDVILQCDFTFVALGGDGRPTPFSKKGLGKKAGK